MEVLDLFLSFCLLLTRKGCEVYLSYQQCTSHELRYENPLKILFKDFFCWVGLFVYFGICLIWFDFGFLFSFFFYFLIFKIIFGFESGNQTNTLKSQRNQGNGKTAKIFVYRCRTVLGEEVDDQCSVSPVKLCSSGSGACPRLCMCACAASQGFCLHPHLSGKETKAFRKKMKWNEMKTRVGLLHLRLWDRKYSKEECSQSFAKTGNVFEECGSPGRNWLCWRVFYNVKTGI